MAGSVAYTHAVRKLLPLVLALLLLLAWIGYTHLQVAPSDEAIPHVEESTAPAADHPELEGRGDNEGNTHVKAPELLRLAPPIDGAERIYPRPKKFRLRDAHGAPLAGWKLTCLPHQGWLGRFESHRPRLGTQEGTTDANGHWQNGYGGVLESVIVSSPGGVAYKAMAPFALTTTHDGRVLDLVLPTTRVVRGRVEGSGWDPDDRVWVIRERARDVSPQGQVLYRVAHVEGRFGGGLGQAVPMAEDGSFEVALPLGTWRLHCDRTEPWDAYVHVRETGPAPTVVFHRQRRTSESLPTRVRIVPAELARGAGISFTVEGRPRRSLPAATESVRYEAASGLVFRHRNTGVGELTFGLQDGSDWTLQIRDARRRLIHESELVPGDDHAVDLTSVRATQVHIPVEVSAEIDVVLSPLESDEHLQDVVSHPRGARSVWLPRGDVARGHLTLELQDADHRASGSFLVPPGGWTEGDPPLRVRPTREVVIVAKGPAPGATRVLFERLRVFEEVRRLEARSSRTPLRLPGSLDDGHKPTQRRYRRARGRRLWLVLEDQTGAPLLERVVEPGARRVELDIPESLWEQLHRTVRLTVTAGSPARPISGLRLAVDGGAGGKTDRQGELDISVAADTRTLGIRVGARGVGGNPLRYVIPHGGQAARRLHLPELRAISLALSTPDGMPVAQARVTLEGDLMDAEGHTVGSWQRLDWTEALEGVTDAAGHLDLRYIPEGPLRLEVTPHGEDAPRWVGFCEPASVERVSVRLRER